MRWFYTYKLFPFRPVFGKSAQLKLYYREVGKISLPSVSHLG